MPVYSVLVLNKVEILSNLCVMNARGTYFPQRNLEDRGGLLGEKGGMYRCILCRGLF